MFPGEKKKSKSKEAKRSEGNKGPSESDRGSRRKRTNAVLTFNDSKEADRIKNANKRKKKVNTCHNRVCRILRGQCNAFFMN